MASTASLTPPMPSPTDSNADDPRAMRMIDAAYELLDEDGLEGLTIRAVLARTGFARRAFYDNFTSKDDLVLAVFARTIRLAAGYYQSRGADFLQPIDRLHLIVTSIGLGGAGQDQQWHILKGDGITAWDRLHTGTKRGAALSREHLRLADSRPSELQAALTPLLALIASHLREGMASGQFRNGDADLIASYIYNLVSTTVHSEYLAEEISAANPDRRMILTRELWEFCRRAIAV
jgi:AcrR family transcriptional regulator